MGKIALYINTLGFGGAERVLCNLANQLSQKGNEVILITSYASEKEYSCDDKVRRICLSDHRIDRFIKRNIYLIKQLRRVLKAESPDVLLSFMAEPNYRAILASFGLRIKRIVSVRNDPDKEYPGALNRIFAKFIYRFADGVIFQTNDAQKWFPKSIQKKSEVIFNQVDEAFYNIKPILPRHDVVTAGRLTAQKNHKMLIQAFASVADQFVDNLIIYGEGELRNELEALVTELHMGTRIFLPGITNNLAEAIVSAKLFILSSDYEGMPNALMEAMAMGIPCISTDCPCGGPKMLFGELLADHLCVCGDEKGLSRKIKEMLTQNADGKTEKMLSEQFSSKIVFEKWEKYIMNICKHDADENC